jgi:hypothetical protein
LGYDKTFSAKVEGKRLKLTYGSELVRNVGILLQGLGMMTMRMDAGSDGGRHIGRLVGEETMLSTPVVDL